MKIACIENTSSASAKDRLPKYNLVIIIIRPICILNALCRCNYGKLTFCISNYSNFRRGDAVCGASSWSKLFAKVTNALQNSPAKRSELFTTKMFLFYSHFTIFAKQQSSPTHRPPPYTLPLTTRSLSPQTYRFSWASPGFLWFFLERERKSKYMDII